jgi:hypothetical protein
MIVSWLLEVETTVQDLNLARPPTYFNRLTPRAVKTDVVNQHENIAGL